MEHKRMMQVVESITNILESYQLTNVDDMRRILGTVLSSTHAVALASAKTDAEFKTAENMVNDTVMRLYESAVKISKDCGREFTIPS